MMRDLFDDMFQYEPLDPIEAARRGLRTTLRRRFYERAAVTEGAHGFAITLDGRPVKTPARRTLAAPSSALADALAAEWLGQVEYIDPAKMPLTRLANSIIDGVADKSGAVIAEVEKYLGSDLLFYRASDPDGLVARQSKIWDPLIAWVGHEFGAHFVSTTALAFVEQPRAALAAARAAIPDGASSPTNSWRLGALHSVTTLTGSALIALALMRGRLTVDEAWVAAHVDEDWNMNLWGRDEAELERRAFRFEEMKAAATVLQLTSPR